MRRNSKTKDNITLDVKAYIDAENRFIRSIPVEMLPSKDDAIGLLQHINDVLGKPSVNLGGYYCPATWLVMSALRYDCFTLSDIQKILSTPVQYLQIYDITLGTTHNPDEGIEGDIVNQSQYLDFLLFVAELHDPSVNRLRKDKRRYEMVCLAESEYDQTPEPKVATRGWERTLRKSKVFAASAKSINRFAEHLKIPFWAVCDGNRSTDSRHWLLAFDKEFTLDCEKSKKLTREQNTKDTMGMPDGELFRPPFLEFCMENNLAFAGVPFYEEYDTKDKNDSDAKPIHLLPQHPSVSFCNNSYRILIPSFYRSSHIRTKLNTDFHDIQFALGRNLEFKSRDGANVPRKSKDSDTDDIPDEAPLVEDEMAKAAKCIYTVLQECFPYSQAQAYRCVAIAMSPWWTRDQNGDDYHRSLIRAIAPPSDGLISDSTKGRLSLDKIIQMVANNLAIEIDSSLKYAFDRYRCCLMEHKLI